MHSSLLPRDCRQQAILYFVIIASWRALLLRQTIGVSGFAPGYGLSGFVESTPPEALTPAASNILSMS